MVTREKLDSLRKGKITAVANVEGFLREIKRQKSLNAFLHVNENVVEQAGEVDKKLKKGKAGKLAGLAIAVKSNINVSGLPITCGSKTLENYYGTYDADVIKKIRAQDGLIIGMTNMDEFACGSSGESSAFGPTNNPSAAGMIPGGSSSGSAAAVAAGLCDLAIGSDTGGSVRNPASHCGVVGIKPSYGRVSRFGLIDMCMSIEQIGTLSRDVYGAALLLEVISGKSSYDAVTSNAKVGKYSDASARKPKSIRIGLSSDFEKLCTDKRIYSLINEKVAAFAKQFGKVQNVSLKYVDLSIQAYYPIVYVEFFSGTRKFDGKKYGAKIEDVCGEEVLRRIMGGMEISRAEHHGSYYRKALMAKKLIARDFEEAFRKVDVMMLPITPVLPHRIGTKITDPRVMYGYDAFTIPANLSGVCAGVIPAGKIDNIPVGLQVMAPSFKEEMLVSVMSACAGDNVAA